MTLSRNTVSISPLPLQKTPAPNSTDGLTGVGITGTNALEAIDLACFAAGTVIATEQGNVRVEALREGDRVYTYPSGEFEPVVWLGHREVACRRHPRPWDVRPVRVLAGAFGAGRPARDLRLSPDHAVLVEGVLIPIRYLINGTTIAQEAVDRVTYWHVELTRHAVIHAEGLPCESYLDTGNRAAFANGGPALQLHLDFALNTWRSRACARLVCAGAELEMARGALLERARGLGFSLTEDPDVHLVLDGRVVHPEVNGGSYRFHLASGGRCARLSSRSAPPAHVYAGSADHRRLGVAVSSIRFDGRPVDLSGPRVGAGWYDVEYDGATPLWRWTDGNGHIELGDARTLDIDVAMTARYWAEPARATHAGQLLAV